MQTLKLWMIKNSTVREYNLKGLSRKREAFFIYCKIEFKFEFTKNSEQEL